MKRTPLLLIMLIFAGSIAKAQDAPPVVPCGLGQADNIPCYDTTTGKVIHTDPQLALPHQDLTNPLPTANGTAEPVTVPKIAIPPSASAGDSVPPAQPTPYWTFSTDSAYFHDGNQTQRVEIQKLQTVVQPSRDFANGEAIGQGLGGLIAKWLVHRQQVKLERKNIRQQIIAYYDATKRLDDEQRSELQAINSNYSALSQIDRDPARRKLYIRAERTSVPWNVALTKLDSLLDKDRPVILRSKHVGFLRQMLPQAKAFYDLQLEYARKLYSLSQLSGVLVGYYRWKQSQRH